MINHRKSRHSVMTGRVSCNEASAPLASAPHTTKMAPTFSMCVLSASTKASSRHLHLMFYCTNFHSVDGHFRLRHENRDVFSDKSCQMT